MFDFFKSKTTISFNGKTYNGTNIRVENDKVFIDGKLVEEGLTGILKVEVTGDLARLDCNSAVVNGNIGGDVEANTLTCGNIEGDVEANTVHCHRIEGDVDANVVNNLNKER